MIKLLTIISVLSVMGFTTANAAATGGTKSEITGGGSDGCGLGWQVTDKKTMLATTTRGTTNSFVPPTFGMTTGTIGCEKHEISKNEQPAAAFAVANFQALSTELAQGNGETVSGLAYLMGCNSAELGQSVKANYETIANAQSGIELYRGIRSVATCGAGI